jgi:signal transduction histidine kinase
MAILLNNIGMIYKNLGNYKKALEYCQKSITMKEKLGEDETLIFPPLTSISEIYIKLGDYAQAAKYGNRSLQIAQDAGDNKLLRDAYLLLSEINDASKNYKLALEYYKLYTQINATLFNEESNKQITELSIRYETDKKSNEIVQKANENKLLNTKYQIQRNYFIIIVSLILILTIVIYNRYRSKRKANTLLSDKNQQIVEQHQKLEALFKQLRESEEKLREANITKDKFFQIIAHDLKSPMQSLLLSSDLLVRFRHQFNELQLEKKLFHIRKTTRHLSDLLESLLQWARTQTGNIEYKPEKIDLNILMLENMNLLSGNAYKKNIEIISDVQDNTMVYADSNMITTVIRNLLSNAIKFTPDGGKITLAAHENGTHVEFSVADTGIGISNDDLLKLFRIDVHHTTIGTGEEKGTGLGLILCKEFIEKNNGKITVESELSKGSMFKFILPKEEINHNS